MPETDEKTPRQQRIEELERDNEYRQAMSHAMYDGPKLTQELLHALQSLEQLEPRATEPRLSYEQWSAILSRLTGIVIKDPDGFRESWGSVISGVRSDRYYTLDEFCRRAIACTVGRPKPGLFQNMGS